MACEPGDTIDQRMLELVYNLLDDADAARLQEEIAREGAAREAFERAQRMAGVFSIASKWHEAPVEAKLLRAAAVNGSHTSLNIIHTQVNAARRLPVAGIPHSAFNHSAFRHDPSSSPRRALQWAVGLAATVLFAFALGGYLHHRGRLSAIAERYLRVTVTGPSQLAPDAANEFQIKTTDLFGDAKCATLQCTVVDPEGRKLFAEQTITDSSGSFELQLPEEATRTQAAWLEVLAFHGGESYRLGTSLPVSPDRFLTHLSTDKPRYRPGEVVRYRSLTLRRIGLDTPDELAVHFEIRDPAGSVVAGSELQGVTQRGVGNGEFLLPADRPGGQYQLVARSLNSAFPEEKRTFYVREHRTPQLKKELVFVRDRYTPGDRVAADLSVAKPTGGPAAEAEWTITATVDGQTIYQAREKAPLNETRRVEFELPKEIERGDGQLAVVCDDGVVRETIAKTIPIQVGKLEVFFCPEGGDLVAGLQNRVYFKATNPLGKPVDIEGTVVGPTGEEVAKLETEQKGMGSFKFTPLAKAAYEVRLDRPAGVKTESKLPTPNAARSVVLSTGKGVFDADEPIQATLQSMQAELPLVVAAYCRGVQVGQRFVTVGEGENRLTVPISAEAAGVIRVTVYDYSDHAAETGPRAIAERLVYRKPARRLEIRIAKPTDEYAPGDTVQLSLLALNEAGKPAKAAVFGCAVVDDSLAQLAGDDWPAMPTHFYLTSEVEEPEDLEKADFFLSDDPGAEEALDLLLGTQGWRRFVEQPLEKQPQKANETQQPAQLAPVERRLAIGSAALPPTVLDNLEEVRADYERVRSRAEADYRISAAQLRRAVIYGGLLLGALLIAIRLAPWMRQAHDWSALAALRQFGPALVGAALCLLVGLLWTPAMPELPDSELVALQEFKLQPPAAADDLGLETRDADIDGSNANAINHSWYWGRNFLWADIELAKQLGEQHLAYFDFYPKDIRGKAFKLRAGTLEDPISVEFLEGLDQIVMAGHPQDAERVMQVIQRIESTATGLRQVEQFRFPVREYAHQRVSSENGVRADFAETLYWHPLLVADENGRAQVEFQLADSIASYRVLAEGHDGAGRVGTGTGEIVSRLPAGASNDASQAR